MSFYLGKNGYLYMRVRPRLPPCHLGLAQLIPSATSAQLNLYELANRNQNMAYSEQKEGPRQTLPYNPDVRQTPKKGLNGTRRG